MVFPVVMYACESWTLKTAEHQRIDAFELWCWRRLLRVPWTARSSYQSILKEISPEYSLEGLMLKRKLQHFGHLMWRTDSFEKALMLERLKAGGEGDNRGWDGWMASPTRWTWVWVSSRSWWWIGNPGVLQSMGLQRVEHDWVTELNWSHTTAEAGRMTAGCFLTISVRTNMVQRTASHPAYVTKRLLWAQKLDLSSPLLPTRQTNHSVPLFSPSVK